MLGLRRRKYLKKKNEDKSGRIILYFLIQNNIYGATEAHLGPIKK